MVSKSNSIKRVPTGIGTHTFYVKAESSTGKFSPIVSYGFKIITKDVDPLPGGFILQDNARKLSDADLSQVTSLTENTITFSNPSEQIQKLKVGDIIYGVRSTYPSLAIARKITGIPKFTNSKDVWSFLTKIVTLAEIFKEGKVEFDHKIIDYNKDLDRILLYDKDGNTQTWGDQTNLYASIDLLADLKGKIEFSNSLTANLEFDFSGTIELDFISAGGLNLTKEVSLLSLSTGVLVAGPIAFKVNSEIYVILKSSLEGNLSTGMEGSMDFNTNARYANSWSIAKELKISMQKKETTFELEGGLKLAIGIRSELIFYEAGGPSIGVKPYLELDLNHSRNPIVELYAGIDGEIGIATGWLAIGVPSKYWELTGPRNLIYSYGDPTNQAPVFNSVYPFDNFQEVGIDQTLTWDFSDPEGDPLVYDIYFGKSNPPLLEKEKTSNKYYWHEPFEENTKYYWKVVAHDGQNSTSTGVLSFTTKGSSENLDKPYNPSPSEGETNVGREGDLGLLVDFSWECNDPSSDWNVYHLYVGDSENDLRFIISLTEKQRTHFWFEENKKYYWRIDKNIYGSLNEITQGDVWSFTTKGGSGGGETGTVTDSRDGRTYKTVIIFGRKWFAENFDYASPNSTYYKNDSSNKEDGRLYSLKDASNYALPGWRLPTEEEWEELADSIGVDFAGVKLREVGTNSWITSGGTDEYGFGAKAAGYKSHDGNFHSKGIDTDFWSSTLCYQSESKRSAGIDISQDYLFTISCWDDPAMLSVRYIKD